MQTEFSFNIIEIIKFIYVQCNSKCEWSVNEIRLWRGWEEVFQSVLAVDKAFVIVWLKVRPSHPASLWTLTGTVTRRSLQWNFLCVGLGEHWSRKAAWSDPYPSSGSISDLWCFWKDQGLLLAKLRHPIASCVAAMTLCVGPIVQAARRGGTLRVILTRLQISRKRNLFCHPGKCNENTHLVPTETSVYVVSPYTTCMPNKSLSSWWNKCIH